MKQKIIFLKFNSSKNEIELNNQIEKVVNYLLKRYGYNSVCLKAGAIQDDFINGFARLKLTFKK